MPAPYAHAGETAVFIRRGGHWAQEGKVLVGAGARDVAGQGQSVALSGDGNTAIVGGAADNRGVGAAWVFVAAPSVASINPADGPAAGGTTVAIKGNNFAGATAVDFGGTAVTSFTVRSATSIIARTPSHRAGKVAVTVRTAGGVTQRPGAFTFN